MKKVILFLLLTCIVATFACKKNKDTDPDHPYGDDVILVPSVSDYSQMKPGNYWVYQEFEVDSMGNGATPTSFYDSCYVEKDTIIRGNVFHKYIGPSRPYPYPYNIGFLRDSADCIVDKYGIILFSVSNFSTPLRTSTFIEPLAGDTVYTSELWMTDKNQSTTVPAGTFVTVNAQTRYHFFPPYDFGGVNRSRNTKYSVNVGMVLITENFYVSNPNYRELRLVRYLVK
jgi:hypothetical protein